METHKTANNQNRVGKKERAAIVKLPNLRLYCKTAAVINTWPEPDADTGIRNAWPEPDADTGIRNAWPEPDAGTGTKQPCDGGKWSGVKTQAQAHAPAVCDLTCHVIFLFGVEFFVGKFLSACVVFS